MRRISTACFVAIGFLLNLLGMSVASAEVDGAILASERHSFTARFEGNLGMLWKNGSLPVTFYVLKPTDTEISKIWVDRYKLSYFPAWFDALTCDLNPDICRRNLIVPAGSIADSAIRSTFELGISHGVWSKLEPGTTIILPDLVIARDTTSIPKPWEAAKSYEDLKKNNYACKSELIPGVDCETLFDYYNPRAKIDKDHPEIYQNPIYVYTIGIDSDCVKVCAVMKPARDLQLAAVDAKGPAKWNEPPFELLTKSDPSTLGEVAVARGVRKVAAIDNSPTFKAKQTTSITKVPRDKVLDIKIDKAGQSFEKNGWKKIDSIVPFSNFGNEQTEWLEAIHVPDKDAPSNRLLDRIQLPQNVMIVDRSFDEQHCEFSKDSIIVYDCKNPDNKFSDDYECIIRMPKPQTETTVEVAGANRSVRPLCGPAGVAELDVHAAEFRDSRHGTHLAGIIASKWDNFGTGGINPMAKIVAVEIDFDKTSEADYGQWLAARLSKIMILNGVRIVNLSLGFPIPAPAEDDETTDEASAPTADWLTHWITFKSTAVFVAAGGNKRDAQGACTVMPACNDTLNNVVSVVALDSTGTAVFGNANFNKKFMIGAMGNDIYAPTPGNLYGRLSGSSQAAAIVSGAISLATSIDKNSSMEPSQIRNRLVVCSAIASTALMGKMKGGLLDFDCLTDAQSDVLYLKDGQAVRKVVGKVIQGGPLTFKDNQTTNPDPLPLTEILGFQRLPGSVEDVAIFQSTPTEEDPDWFTRRRGKLVATETISIQVGNETLDFKIGDISKYVRKSI